MRLPYAYAAAAALLAGALAAAVQAGPAGGGYHVPSSAFSAGGGQTATGGGYAAAGSFGTASAVKMSGGSYTVAPGIVASQRPAAVDLSAAHAFPVPFIPSKGHTQITFTRMTTRATIRIYSVSGELVKEITKDSSATDAVSWSPVANEAGEPVASGVYLYHIKSAEGHVASGKLMVIK